LKKQFDIVECVTDGQQAIDAVQQHPVNYFSMIILDINMPGKNGIQACTEITDYFESGQLNKSGDNFNNIKYIRSP